MYICNPVKEPSTIGASITLIYKFKVHVVLLVFQFLVKHFDLRDLSKSFCGHIKDVPQKMFLQFSVFHILFGV